MSCITTDRKTDLESDLTAVLADIIAMNTAISGVATSGTKSYSFDSGTGRAAQVFNSPMEMISARDRLIARRDYLRRALNGTTLIRQQTRRS